LRRPVFSGLTFQGAGFDFPAIFFGRSFPTGAGGLFPPAALFGGCFFPSAPAAGYFFRL
jgi:hypothetical protein